MSSSRIKAAKQRPASQDTPLRSPDYPTSLWLGEGKVRRSISSLTKTEISSTSVTQDVPPVNIEDVWTEIRALERHHSASSRYRRIGRTMEPVIDFFMRFSPVLDSMVQYGSSSATLIWGSLKAVLVIAKSSISYFYFVDNAMLKLSDILSISRQYEKMFVQKNRVRIALSDLYDEIYLFLEKIRIAVTTSSWRVFLKNLRKSFDSEFNDNINHIERYTRIYNDEITLAHRQCLDASQKHLEKLVGSVCLDSTSLICRAESCEASELRDSALRWLSQVDPSEDFHRALKKRSTATGVWLLDTASFRSWSEFSDTPSDSAVLWINGRPGSGKTVLSATAIEHLQRSKGDVPVAYFYCDSGDIRKKSTLNVCGSILSQLVVQLPSVPPGILEAYGRAKRYGRHHISLSDDLFSVLKDVVASLQAVYIILDGIDECDDAGELTKSFADIARNVTALRLACVSRKIPAIQNELEGATLIHLDTNLVQPDIDRYISRSLGSLPGKGTDAQDRIFLKLSQAADGMFLFAFLGVQSLRQAVDDQSMIDAATSIPAGLDGVYGRGLERLSSQSLRRRHLARKILIWVCCSTRPLSWKELQSALSWDDIREAFLESQRPFKDAVLDLCSPLVEYQAEKDTFHAVHFSVREYLCNSDEFSSLSAMATQFLIKEPHAHQEIAKVALTSLSMPEVIHCIKVDSRRHPLVRYFTENWCFHLASSSFDSIFRERYEAFVSSPLARSTWILRFLISDKQSFPLQRIAKLQKLVHDWKNQSDNQTDKITTFVADDLADIQRALIDFDLLLPSEDQVEKISNFERNLIVRDLARAYTMAMKLDQGIQLFSSALNRVHHVRGTEPLDSAWLLNSLGILYDQQGLTALATRTQRQALAVQEKHLPGDHLDITLTVNELGRMTRHLGHFKEAEAYHLRALRTLRKVLPESDMQIIWTINTLARSYRCEGRSGEALELHRQALNGQTRLMGEDHPHALWTMGDIARCLRDEGKYEDAIEMMRTVYDRRISVLGALHPDTLWTLNNIGLLCESLGNMDDAKQLHAKALQCQTSVLGAAHAHTLWTASTLERLTASAASK